MTNAEIQSILKNYPGDFEINILTEITNTQIQDKVTDVAVSTKKKTIIIIGTEWEK